MPRGVHGSGPRTFSTRRPRLIGCRPSASLAGSIGSRTADSSTCGRQRQLDDVAGAGRVGVELVDHRRDVGLGGGGRQLALDAGDAHLAQSRCLPATYHRLPGSSPTSRVPRPGRRRRRQRGHARGELGADRRRGGLAVEDRRGHAATVCPRNPRDRRCGPRLRTQVATSPRAADRRGVQMTEREPTPPHGSTAVGARPSQPGQRDPRRQLRRPRPGGRGPENYYTAPKYSTTPIAVRRPDVFAALLLVLAGVAAADQPVPRLAQRRGRLRPGPGPPGFETFGDGLGQVFSTGFWQPLTGSCSAAGCCSSSACSCSCRPSPTVPRRAGPDHQPVRRRGRAGPAGPVGLGLRQLRPRLLVRDRRSGARPARQPQGAALRPPLPLRPGRPLAAPSRRTPATGSAGRAPRPGAPRRPGRRAGWCPSGSSRTNSSWTTKMSSWISPTT